VRRARPAVALAASVGLWLAALVCLAPPAGAAAAPGPPVAGGSLTMSAPTAPSSLDPAISVGGLGGASQSWLMLAIYGTLVHVSNAGVVTPDLAQSLTSADSINWTLTLRPNVVFSDGTPLDAAAVQFNLQRDLASTVMPDAKNIASMAVASPTVLQITLHTANSAWPFVMQDELGAICSPTAVRVEGQTFAQRPVGAGPFVLQSAVAGSQYNLLKNQKYYGAPTTPYLSSLIFKIIPDDQAQYTAFDSGQTDMLYYPTPASQIALLNRQGYHSTAPLDVGGGAVVFNTAVAPFNDVNMRKAFTEAVNLKTLSKQASNGVMKPVVTLFPPSSPLKNQVKQAAYNLKDAQALVDAYVAQHGTIHLTLSEAPNQVAELQALAAQWSLLKGVQVTQNPVTAAQAVAQVQAHTFQIAPTLMAVQDPGAAFVSAFTTSSPGNVGAFSNTAFDALAPRGLTIPLSTVKVRRSLYSSMSTILLKTGLPWLWTYQAYLSYFAKSTVHGVQEFGPGYMNWPDVWTSKP
jgi:peptide/nickel transport system substrate-binding protein